MKKRLMAILVVLLLTAVMVASVDECQTGADCDDSNPSTFDACSGQPPACIHIPITECLEGDNYCPQTCTFQNDPDCGECLEDGECNDNNPQTQDMCRGEPKRCVYEEKTCPEEGCEESASLFATGDMKKMIENMLKDMPSTTLIAIIVGVVIGLIAIILSIKNIRAKSEKTEDKLPTQKETIHHHEQKTAHAHHSHQVHKHTTHQHKHHHTHQHRPEIKQYVRQCRVDGFHDDQIYKTLVKHGMKHEEANSYF